ncbi:TetR/AcrR family transcriptional regulator [Rufibacter psychrotolerans]|uniref:TetR/AcrR family transcriptional regulator n=1 Tax=Rufibacter psychrotolerans TaxID=2812556 RepID=UPI0019684050|nr:TetR/AcrR family transcriptional regulator [Rufibacter sp. SYSU D00308]
MTFKQTVLQELLTLIRQEGLSHLSEQEVINRVDISSATFREFFNGMDDLVTQVVEYDLEMRQQEHQRLFAQEPSPLRRLLLIIQLGLETLRTSQPAVLQELQENYPAAWRLYWNHSNEYTTYLLHELLNEGVLQHELRRDINIQLVTKIMIEQLSIIVNPAIFPPERFHIAEVFRSIFLYYVRGICTEAGMKKAEDFFAAMK